MPFKNNFFLLLLDILLLALASSRKLLSINITSDYKYSQTCADANRNQNKVALILFSFCFLNQVAILATFVNNITIFIEGYKGRRLFRTIKNEQRGAGSKISNFERMEFLNGLK